MIPANDPPPLETNEADSLRFLKIAMLFVVVGCMAAFVLVGYLAPGQTRRLAGFVLTALAAAATLVQLRRGRPKSAYLMLTYGAWVGLTVSAFLNGGMSSPAILAYPVMILVAGWVMDGRTILTLAGISIAAEILFVLGARYGWLPQQAPPPPAWVFFAHTLILGVSASLAVFVRRGFKAQIDTLARREAELSSQYSLYHTLLDAQAGAGIGLFIIENGRIAFSNTALRAQLGYTDEELRALPSFIGLVHPDDRERVMENHRRRLAGERFENRYDIGALRKDGERREIEITVATLPDSPDGGLLVITVDITERKRAEQAMQRLEERFAQVFHASPVAASIARADGTFIEVNDIYRQNFGWSRDELLGRTSVDIGLWPAPAVRRAWVEELKRHGTLRDYETVWLHKSGEPRNVRISAVAMEFAGEPCILAQIYDITELRQSELRFSQVFNVSPVAAAISRLEDGRHLEVNEAFLRLFGHSREQAVGRTPVELGIWPSREAWEAWAAALYAGGSLIDHETELFGSGGEKRLVTISADIIDFAGERCILSFVHDISAHRHAEATLREIVEGTSRVTGDEFFRALVRHLASALDVPAALVGEIMPGDSTRLRTLAFWAGDRFAPEIDYRLADTPCGQVFGRRPRLIASGLGERFPNAGCVMQTTGAVSYYGYPLADAAGEPLGVLAIMDNRPMHESEERSSLMSIFAARAAAELVRKRAEAEVRRLNAELEKRVRRRTSELTEVNRELESFAYSMSHDLRAPLRGIDGFSRLLQEEYGDRLDKQGNEYLARVRRGAQRMGTLIDDLLELSRVTRREMHRVDVDLSALANEIVEELHKAEPQRAAAVDIELGCTANGDPQLMRVLMENLIGNAWKYSAPVGQARIAFGRESVDGENCFFVRDNGVGFDMAYADKLFAPFQRLHNPTEFEGSGIGLASAARVVRRHGGRIWGESRPGEGATFRFTLSGAA